MYQSINNWGRTTQNVQHCVTFKSNVCVIFNSCIVHIEKFDGFTIIVRHDHVAAVLGDADGVWPLHPNIVALDDLSLYRHLNDCEGTLAGYKHSSLCSTDACWVLYSAILHPPTQYCTNLVQMHGVFKVICDSKNSIRRKVGAVTITCTICLIGECQWLNVWLLSVQADHACMSPIIYSFNDKAIDVIGADGPDLGWRLQCLHQRDGRFPVHWHQRDLSASENNREISIKYVNTFDIFRIKNKGIFNN